MDTDDVMTVVPSTIHNPHWSDPPAIEWTLPTGVLQSFRLAQQQEAALNNMWEASGPTKTGCTHWLNGGHGQITLDTCITCRSPHIRVVPLEENDD